MSAREDDVIDLVLVADFDQAFVVGCAALVADHLPLDSELLGQRPAVGPIAEHDGGLRTDAAIANCAQHAPAAPPGGR